MKTCAAVFLLILFFSPLPECVAVNMQAVYDPGERSGGEGFFDGTLGEARRNAFERVLCVFGNTLRGDFTIRVSARFGSFPGDTSTIVTLAAAAPCHVAVIPQTGETGLLYPSALARAVFGEDRIRGICDDYDIRVIFNARANTFHYGQSATRGTVDFTSVALHEIFHGLGFLEYIESDGSLLSDMVSGSSGQPSRRITLTSVWDRMMYSEADGDRLISLTDAQRREAITSGDGLLWDGTAGRRAAASKSAGVSSDGRPRLYAPSVYESSSSVSHLDLSIRPDDLMEPFYNNSGDMTLALAMLEDMGWNVNAGAGTQACGGGATPRPAPSPAPAPPPSADGDDSSRPETPPIPIPPPVPETVPAQPTDASPPGTENADGEEESVTEAGGSGGCFLAPNGGTGQRNIAFGDLLLALSVPLLAVFAKRTKSEE